MKICHVITRMILGGAQENTLLTCEGLHGRGHEVTLVTGPAIGPEGELMHRARSGGYKVLVVDAMRREISPWRDLQAYKELSRVLRDTQPEIVHSHSSKAGILARRAAWKAGGMRIVHTVHGLPFHRYQSRWRNRLYVCLERSAASYSDALISVANAMTAQALSAGVGNPSHYTTIYSGMETDPFLARPAQADELRRAMSLPEDAILVTQVSRLAELKGHEYILRAASGMEDSRVHFCFVGDGQLRTRTEADIASHGLADRFHLTGLVSPEQIPAVMHASDIVVHCSLREGLARAIPQAMLAGKPVISFDVDGAREVVNSETGVLLPPKDVDGLKLAIEALAGQPELRRRLGQAGRARCSAMFDHRLMVDQIERVYRRIITDTL